MEIAEWEGSGNWGSRIWFSNFSLADQNHPLLLFMQPWAVNDHQLWGHSSDHFAWPPGSSVLSGLRALYSLLLSGFPLPQGSPPPRALPTQQELPRWVLLLYSNWAITYLIWKYPKIKVQKNWILETKRIWWNWLLDVVWSRVCNVAASCRWLWSSLINWNIT